MSVNALRGHLSEFGMIAAKAALKVLAQHLEAIGAAIAALDKEIAATHAQSPAGRLLASIPGDCRQVRYTGLAKIGKIAARRSPPARQSRVFSSLAATFPLGSDRRPGKIPVAARKSPAPSPNRATAPSGGCACPAEQSRQAIAEARHRWFARSGQAERLAARLAGRSSRAQAREARHRRSGQQARTDHMGRHDEKRGVSHRDFRTAFEPA